MYYIWRTNFYEVYKNLLTFCQLRYCIRKSDKLRILFVVQLYLSIVNELDCCTIGQFDRIEISVFKRPKNLMHDSELSILRKQNIVQNITECL